MTPSTLAVAADIAAIITAVPVVLGSAWLGLKYAKRIKVTVEPEED